MLLVVANLLAAVLADVNRTLRIALWPPQLRELQDLELAARRTRHPVLPLVALLIRRLDPAHAGDLRCRYQKHFAARERPRARHRQRDRVALALHIAGIGVHFVEEQVPRGHRPQADRAVRAGHHQHAARKSFDRTVLPESRDLGSRTSFRRTSDSSISGSMRCFELRLAISTVGCTDIIGPGAWWMM